MTSGSFPSTRLRRNRGHARLRDLVRETSLTLNDLILPLFVRSGVGVRHPISSMPGNYQMSLDIFQDEVREIVDLGIPGIVLFGIPDTKDEVGSDTWNDDGIIQQAVRVAKELGKDNLLVITDVCFCEYTSHGHCGVLHEVDGHTDVNNDATLENLAMQSASHARAGADMVAPSGMMDGMIQAIRTGLDQEGFDHTPIMSYAAKYASAFYGPFREAAESTPQFGDRRSYQMDPANSNEAIREVQLDIDEGADIVMVKPAMAYLDIIRRVRDNFQIPVAAYNVSGEFAMVKAAAEKGWVDEQRTVLELLTSIKRAGADMILTYFAKDVARWLS